MWIKWKAKFKPLGMSLWECKSVARRGPVSVCVCIYKAVCTYTVLRWRRLPLTAQNSSWKPTNSASLRCSCILTIPDVTGSP